MKKKQTRSRSLHPQERGSEARTQHLIADCQNPGRAHQMRARCVWRAYVCGRRMLLGRASSNSPGGNATAGETPMIVGQRGTDQGIESSPHIEVSFAQGVGLERGRDGPT